MRTLPSLVELRLLVKPNGLSAVWIHPLDLTTGHYPQYDGWTDCTDMDDGEFETFVVGLQKGA
jgi:hypothetical protein